MRSIMNRLNVFRKDESGITMLEYGILAALITVLSIPMITAIGPKLQAAFTTINTALP